MSDILELVQPPFGPYPYDTILNPKWRREVPLPVLEDVFFWLDGKAVGLDTTEYINPPPENHPIAKGVEWYGTLRIKTLNAFTAVGLEWLENDLRKRDMATRGAEQSGLTLASLFGQTKQEGTPIKVYLQGMKTLPLTGNLIHPTKRPYLLVSHHESPEHIRRFYVGSLDVDIIADSQHFFMRYQLLSVMTKTVAEDSFPPPLEDRDIDYWVDGYLLHRDRERHHRMIFKRTICADGDGQYDGDGSDTDEHGRTTRPRHLRHLHRSDVTGFFASQAEWILAQQVGVKQRNLRLICVYHWKQFCLDIRKERREAAKQNVEWGIPKGNARLSLEEYLRTEFFITDRHWTVINKKPEPRNEVPTPPSPTASDTEEAARQFQPAVIQHIYDDDFSVDSSSAASDSDAEIVPNALSRVPVSFWQPPRLIPGIFEWTCPECDYKLDLVNLSAEQLANLPPSLVGRFDRKQWLCTTDSGFQRGFQILVGHHYTLHLKERNVRLWLNADDRPRVGWIRPTRQPL
ncbi:hypothetical protein ONZ45_g1624 [Pleurotus djamor]|nr:hypothetical protein ONZ45_g1624 [Pleurotus djamor]